MKQSLRVDAKKLVFQDPCEPAPEKSKFYKRARARSRELKARQGPHPKLKILKSRMAEPAVLSSSYPSFSSYPLTSILRVIFM